jgi:hypothetical protein
MLRLQMLEKILNDKWTLQSDDKNMIVMYHKFGYELNGEKKQIDSKMVCLVMIKPILQWQKLESTCCNSCFTNIGKIKTPGVQPYYKEVYLPILKS